MPKICRQSLDRSRRPRPGKRDRGMSRETKRVPDGKSVSKKTFSFFASMVSVQKRYLGPENVDGSLKSFFLRLNFSETG